MKYKIKYYLTMAWVMPVFFILTPFVQLWFWWQMTALGTEPKTGEKWYQYRMEGNDTYRRRKGWINTFRTWEKLKPYPADFGNSDIASLYPAIILPDITK